MLEKLIFPNRKKLPLLNALSRRLTWKPNPWPAFLNSHKVLLHLGCGSNIIDNFINIDFIASNSRVIPWNLVCPWPKELACNVDGIFSEDVFEHFFYEEQMYILCEANIALQSQGTFRVLMPCLDRILKLDITQYLLEDGYLDRIYSIQNFGDLLNSALRHSGHKWLHSAESTNLIAQKCGFVCTPTDLEVSRDPKLSYKNLRSENNANSAGYDLTIERKVEVIRVRPEKILNARIIDKLPDGSPVYTATSKDPIIVYKLPRAIDVRKLVLVNARCANISETREHNFGRYYFAESEDASHCIDRSLVSDPFNNFVQGTIVRRKVGNNTRLESIRFDPGETTGDLFTVNELEVFIFRDS